MKRIKSVIPEGCPRARVRATSRATRKLEDGGTLADTLGDEARGMVVIDYDGHPLKYDDLKIMSDVVAKEVNVFKVDVPRENGKGWKRTAVEISTSDAALGEGWREQVASGSQYVIEETWVKANDSHYDAKVWPAFHPHGTGSVLSEPGSGSLKAHARNRAATIFSWFRRAALWAFWFLDRVIKNDLFNLNSRRRRRGRPASAQDDLDSFTRNFGTAAPANIPESSAWWRMQAADLFALLPQCRSRQQHLSSIGFLNLTSCVGARTGPTSAARLPQCCSRRHLSPIGPLNLMSCLEGRRSPRHLQLAAPADQPCALCATFGCAPPLRKMRLIGIYGASSSPFDSSPLTSPSAITRQGKLSHSSCQAQH